MELQGTWRPPWHHLIISSSVPTTRIRRPASIARAMLAMLPTLAPPVTVCLDQWPPTACVHHSSARAVDCQQLLVALRRSALSLPLVPKLPPPLDPLVSSSLQ